MHTVYAVRSPSGSVYIGLSANPGRRWKQHCAGAVRLNPRGVSTRLARSIRKYGPDAFEHFVLATVPTVHEAKIAERIAIAVYRPALNLTAGGDGVVGYKMPPEKVAQIAAKLRGRKASTETLAKLRANASARIGVPRPPEVRVKIRATLTGRKRPPEVTAKMQASLRGRVIPPEVRERMKAGQKLRRAREAAARKKEEQCQ